MSAIAAVVYFDGRPVAPGEVESITATMPHRGPDGVAHWRRGAVALGHCMLRTTPESLQEVQPLTNEDESLVLVMDGRVDNREELRRKLRIKGALLRSDCDAELVLRAYEAWGTQCTHHVVGECVFVVWNERMRCLFAGRDAAGSRHFYYYQGRGWLALASESKGLLALPGVERRLNEERLLDYFVNEFDRVDEVGTIYQGISRLPAGHAMAATQQGLRVWRWWEPAQLPELRFASLDECAEAFLDQLREVVKCRLRSLRPVGALMSGGLDSSTLVGLISKEFRGELEQPLQTFSMIGSDERTCLDWRSVESILKADSWLVPTVFTPERMDGTWATVLEHMASSDDPFIAQNECLDGLVFGDVHRAGCGTLFDGMAGDCLFYSPEKSAYSMLRRRQYVKLFSLLVNMRRLDWHVGELLQSALVAHVVNSLPRSVLVWLRARKDESGLLAGELGFLKRDVARHVVSSRRGVVRAETDRLKKVGDLQRHAGILTSGLLSFAHENASAFAGRHGLDTRSPYSDRRMMEFAIAMPLEAKWTRSWYKELLRKVAENYLPHDVAWRANVGYHPGPYFYQRLVDQLVKQAPTCADESYTACWLSRWLEPDRLAQCWRGYQEGAAQENFIPIITSFVAAVWLERNFGSSLNHVVRRVGR